MAMDLVAKEWNALADRCDIAVELIHYTKKPAEPMPR
jgi:hypothetical protein